MDSIVYYILIGISAPLFFIWRAIFRKFIKNEITRVIATWVTAIISAVVIYACIIIAYLYVLQYYPNRNFSRNEWISNPEKRYELSEDLIKSKLLIGKTYSEVIQLLGESASDSDSSEIYYNIGYEPILLNTHPSILSIAFKAGRVERVTQSHE